MSEELTQPSLLTHTDHIPDPTLADALTGGPKTQGTYASKMPPDHPGLKLERPLPRALRSGPALAALGLLIAGVSIAVGVGLSPRAVDQAKAAPAPDTVSTPKQVQIAEAVQAVPGNDAPIHQAQAPRLGPPMRADGPPSAPAGPFGQGEGGVNPDLAARRQTLREQREKALASPILVELENPTAADQSGATALGAPAGGAASVAVQAAQMVPGSAPAPAGALPGGLGGMSDPNMQQRKNDFLAHDGANSSGYLGEMPSAPRSPYEVKAGTIIPTTLITGIDSDLPGQIVGQVRENVYDTVSGNYLLIPQGSRLIATYDSMVGFGQERVLVCWNRLIRPDGVSVNLECMPGVDLSGYAGFADDVDHHWWRILSGVALGTLLSATAQRSQGDVSGYQPTFPQLWASNAAGSINSAGQAITQKNLQIQPTIKVRPGFTVNVLVSKDMIITPFVRPRFVQ
jgi:type IV secretion system protein VirB10